jgi:serine/threonine-protein kinase
VDGDVPYIAMEVLEGESLDERLKRLGRISPQETARILTHVARALARAHDAGIVHRDLKPENIFLVRNDEEEIAKVLDFGIAKTTSNALSASASGSTRSGALLGTPYYMSPEQAEGIRSLDHRTDIWAMGVIAFECLLGRRPFESETIGSILLAICSRPIPVPSRIGPVPPGFDAWFARTCARNLDERFPSAKETAAELRRLGESGAAETVQPSSGAPSNPRTAAQSVEGFSTTRGGSASPMRARPATTLRIAFAAVGLALVAGAALAWIRWNANPGPAVAPTGQTLVASVPSPVPDLSDTKASASASPSSAAPRAISVTALPRAPAVAPAPIASFRAAPPTPKTAAPAASTHPRVNLGF